MGSGAFGVVIRAIAVRTGCPIALKLVFCTSHPQAQSASQEAEFLLDRGPHAPPPLHHPGIVKMHHFYVLPGWSSAAQQLAFQVREALPDLPHHAKPKWFNPNEPASQRPLHAVCIGAYELVEGGELFDFSLDNFGRDDAGRPRGMPEDMARDVFKQLSEALAYCHKMGVAHRDIKLENTMIHQGPEGVRIKLIDFGLAMRVFCPVPGPSVVGSACYMAPELRTSGKHDLFAADVFSLGVCLYILTVGAPPFKNTTDECRHYRHFRQVRVDLKKGGVRHHMDWYRGRSPSSAYSAQLLALLDALLALDPDHRPTMDQVLGHPWLQALPVTGSPTTPTTTITTESYGTDSAYDDTPVYRDYATVEWPAPPAQEATPDPNSPSPPPSDDGNGVAQEPQPPPLERIPAIGDPVIWDA